MKTIPARVTFILFSLVSSVMLYPGGFSMNESDQKGKRTIDSNAGKLTLPDDSRAGEFRLHIKKAERKLYVFQKTGAQEKLIKTYTIALGNNPTGTKRRQGDGATPEGDYYITHRNPRSNYYLSLGVSYPGISDAEAGLRAKLITEGEHRAIVNAIRNQAKPPQNTALGGDIFIHGGGAGRDWTLGCAALENEHIKELFETIPIRTRVRIDP